MFEQYQKQFEAMMTPSAWTEQTQRANEQAQALFAQSFASTQELVKMEMDNLSQLAQARRPEDFVAAVASSVAKRQAFYAEAAARASDRFKQGQSQLAQMVESKSSEVAAQTGQAVDAAFGGAKQGLDFAQSAVKGVVERAGKAGKGERS